jgi:hypothetical protein
MQKITPTSDMPDHVYEGYIQLQDKLFDILMNELKYSCETTKNHNVSLFLNALVSACANMIGNISIYGDDETLNFFIEQFEEVSRNSYDMYRKMKEKNE